MQNKLQQLIIQYDIICETVNNAEWKDKEC